MSLPLLHTPAQVVATILISGNQASDPTLWTTGNPGQPWPAFENGEPSSPDNVLTVYDTTPQKDGRSMIDGETWWHHGVQVRIRGVDAATAQLKTYSLRHWLDEQVTGLVVAMPDLGGGPATYQVACVSIASVARLGTEVGKSKRWLWTINGKLPVYRVS